MKKSKKVGLADFLNKIFRYIVFLVFIVLAAWLCKSFLFSVYYIPSGSMMPTLGRGDYVLVSKFPYNLRTPEYYPLTDIPFSFFSVGGVGEVNRDDIMVFDLPVFSSELHPSQKEDYIKRCIGLPGDTVAVYEGGYYLKEGNNSSAKKQLGTSLTNTMVIPEKGRWINLTDSTKQIWESILRRDRNSMQVEILENRSISRKHKEPYQVKQSYYFVQGDNTRFSSDSRNWGLVPKSHLIGRAELVLWPWPPRWL